MERDVHRADAGVELAGEPVGEFHAPVGDAEEEQVFR